MNSIFSIIKLETLAYTISRVALDINFYDEAANEGESVFPFLGFCLFIVGIMLMLYATVNILAELREFRIFFDASAAMEKPDKKQKHQKIKKYVIIDVVAIIIIIISNFVIRMQ